MRGTSSPIRVCGLLGILFLSAMATPQAPTACVELGAQRRVASAARNTAK
jgi:hypothetical protein